jgi:hypothetical protein
MQPRARGPSRKIERDLRKSVFEITKLRMSGRISEMMRYFASDVIIHYHCAKEGLFLAGVLQGVDAFRENIRITDAEYEPLDMEVLDLLVEGDRSAVRWRTSWRNRGTGYTRTLDMAHFLHWENGWVVEMFEYLDYHGMMALACN